jgi:TP901 family phage tail tape measure protein
MEFEKAMSAVQAATGATASSMGDLRAAALKAGADTQYSATEAAQGITEMAKAGVSAKDIMGGGLTGVLSLAAAGQLEVADAAGIASTAMTQFSLSGAQLPHVADLLAAGAGKAMGSVDDLGQALNQAGLLASSTGIHRGDHRHAGRVRLGRADRVRRRHQLQDDVAAVAEPVEGIR